MTGVDMTTRFGALSLKNPILTASGTFGYAVELQHLTDLARLGGIATKGISPRPRFGNPTPRMCDSHSITDGCDSTCRSLWFIRSQGSLSSRQLR